MSTTIESYACRCIVRGKGSGIALTSRASMCFYLCDPETGIVLEKGHPLQNRSVTGSILALQSGKGSSVVQVDGFYQLWKKGTLPAAIILHEAEPVIVSAAVIVGLPMVDRVERNIFELIHDGDFVELDADAEEIRIHKRKGGLD